MLFLYIIVLFRIFLKFSGITFCDRLFYATLAHLIFFSLQLALFANSGNNSFCNNSGICRAAREMQESKGDELLFER